MATIIVANTNNEVKEAIKKGCRFKIAPSVTQVLIEDANINYEYIAEALQNSSSVRHLLVNLEQAAPDSKFELLIKAVSSSQVIESLVITTNSERTIAAIGQLLQQNSFIAPLFVISDREIRSKEFFAGLQENKSLRKIQLHIRKWREISFKAGQDMHLHLVSSLSKNNYVQNFTVNTDGFKNEKATSGPKDLTSEGITSIDQISYIEILIQREPTPKQLIQAGNWDKLSEYIKANCHEHLDKQIYLPELSLVTKSTVAKLAVQSLTDLAKETSAKKKSDEQEIQATRQQVQSLSDKIAHLKNQLAKLESEKSVADQRLQAQTNNMNLALTKEKLLNDQLSTFQKHVTTTETATKKWQNLIQTDLHKWSCEDVSILLSEAGLRTYSEIFLANKIDGSVLTALDTNDMMTALNLSFKEAKALKMHIFSIQTHKLFTIPAAVFRWPNKTVCTWLQNNKFGHLIDVFKKHQITGLELVFLEKIDITHHLQINALGDIINLQREIAKLKESLHGNQNQRKSTNDNNKALETNDLLENQIEKLKQANETLNKLKENRQPNEIPIKTIKEQEPKIPEAFICPIAHEVMTDPVVASDGHTYERTAIELWLKNNNTSPMTGVKLANKRLTPSHTLKSLISEFVENSKLVDVAK